MEPFTIPTATSIAKNGGPVQAAILRPSQNNGNTAAISAAPEVEHKAVIGEESFRKEAVVPV